ncbi:MFS transporter [Erysipelothrix urinaevulpis]|uniref:MFS transporter n=1 Tax=Erysipelothrix urinaevulpis TaxID=2683717 RepID=UPI00135897C0|nr:MFS transporter [Erysipelothrix urinaevulpis]
MKLNTKRTFLVGLAFMTISGFWQLYDFVIPLILKNEFMISDTWAGVVMSLDNILALLLLPFFGALSDKTDTKYGKRMPYIVVGSILTIISMIIIPYAAEARNFIAFALGLALVLLSVASYRTPAVALMPDITIKPLRSGANAIINLMGAVGGVVVLVMISLLSPDKMGSYHRLFIAVATFILIAMLVMVFTVNEKQWSLEMQETSLELGIDLSDEEKTDSTGIKMAKEVRRSMIFLLLSIALWFMGYNAVISAFSRYATIQIGFTGSQASTVLLIANVGAILSFIPIGKMSEKIGRKKMILVGVVVLTFAFGTAGLYRQFTPLMFGNFLLAGFAWAAINVNSLPMVLEMASGDDIGKYTGLYYTFSMSAQIITPILSGLLFDMIGYQILFPYAAFFLLVAFLTMMQVHHGDSKLEDVINHA